MNGENSDVIELSKDRFIVMNLADQQPERQKLLDEVEDQIVDILRDEGAKQLIDDLAQNYLFFFNKWRMTIPRLKL